MKGKNTKRDFYLQTSIFTDLGKYKEDAIDLWENKCCRDLKKLCYYLMNATVHRVVIQQALHGQSLEEYGDFSYIDYTTPMSEDDILLTATSMFGEIFRRDPKGFYIGRPAQNRINVTCRYVSVLTSAILKANGIPCRCRAGWAKYLSESKSLDHWVNEYWDEQQKRWIRIDMDDLYDSEYQEDDLYTNNGINKEYLDMPDHQFYTAGQAWIEYRKDKKFLKKLQYGSGYATPEHIVKYLFLDFFAVMNFEPNYKFIPCAFDKKYTKLTKAELQELDTLANLMLDVDKNFEHLHTLYTGTPKYRMLNSPLVDAKNFETLIRVKKYE